jgi:hypothetical protein
MGTDRPVHMGGNSPTEECEITPEMIEAGLDELYSHDITEPRRAEMREAVRAVFAAMCAARA